MKSAKSAEADLREPRDLREHDPFLRPAFAEAALERGVQQARAVLHEARAAALAARGKADRANARKSVKQAAQALGQAEAALAAEQRGEDLAPAVQRRDQVQDGVVLREARVATQGGKRLALVDPLDRLFRRGSITAQQRVAGLRYRHAWEMAGHGAYPTGLDPDAGGRSPPQSGNRRIEAAVGSARELDRLRGMLGSTGTSLLEHVAVEGLAVDGWAMRHRVNAQVALGMLLMALDVVCSRTQAAATNLNRSDVVTKT